MSPHSRRESARLPNSDAVEQLLRESLAENGDPVVKKPWAIKGIDEATIQLCKLAARGKGMKINRWVADALCQAAQTQFGPTAEHFPTVDLASVLDRLSRLEGEVNALSKSHAAIVSAVVSR